MTVLLATTGKGYEELRPRGRDGTSDGIKHHRLLAYAWGEIDTLDDPREVDHAVFVVPWLNVEWNLEAVDPVEHGRLTRSRARRRKSQSMTLDQFAEPEA